MVSGRNADELLDCLVGSRLLGEEPVALLSQGVDVVRSITSSVAGVRHLGLGEQLLRVLNALTQRVHAEQQRRRDRLPRVCGQVLEHVRVVGEALGQRKDGVDLDVVAGLSTQLAGSIEDRLGDGLGVGVLFAGPVGNENHADSRCCADDDGGHDDHQK